MTENVMKNKTGMRFSAGFNTFYNSNLIDNSFNRYLCLLIWQRPFRKLTKKLLSASH
jgi:hypothetical protein